MAPRPDSNPLPSVTVIVAVHNEEAALLGKIENILGIPYPRERIEVVITSDGSTDKTVPIATELADRYPSVRLLDQRDRVGKTVVQNAAVKVSKGEIIIFSDVDAKFNERFLEHITMPFGNPSVGCVTGAVVWTNRDESAVVAGGDFYWRYEHFMWRLESQLGLLAWASGACLAVRRELFKPMEPQYGEDCIVPLDIVSLGYRVVFQPDALAYEARIADPRAEMRARVRMALRSFAGTVSRKHLLNPLRFPGVAWAILSHKLLRWFTPYFLVLAFVLNLLLLGHSVYRVTFALQIIFYVSAVIGGVLDARRIRVPLVSTIYAFSLMNLGVCVGVTRALCGQRVIGYKSEG
jgi:cellulose synthase/poly-beta-1,6-N-acetylglucosamine synthase-like glycosyltransferase